MIIFGLDVLINEKLVVKERFVFMFWILKENCIIGVFNLILGIMNGCFLIGKFKR